MGYSGGTKANPTYRSLGDHSETIQIDYDPQVISYEQLLEAFWNGHNPGSPSWSRQYMSAIFYHTEDQKRLALLAKEKASTRAGGKVHTEILQASTFYIAEGYHQKYYLRQTPELLKEYVAIYPAERDLVNSTAVARVNGFVAGYGTLASLERELGDLGLSMGGKAALLNTKRRFSRDPAGVSGF